MIPDREELRQERLAAKNLDHQFRNRIEFGMGCSRFVSEAITNVVHDVYLPVLDSPLNIKPGQILFQCVAKTVGSSTTIANAKQVTVVLTLDAGESDQIIRAKNDISTLRKVRLCRVCNEAFNQGGLLTVEDLAYRLFNVGERTIVRDLSILRKDGENPPLRSTIKDIGRTITHKGIIIKNWLKGDELSDLNRKYNHSFSAIESYLETFKRVIYLQSQEYTLEKIAYIQKISQQLAKTYVDLWNEYKSKALPHRLKEILEIAELNESSSKKKMRRNP